MKYSIRDLLLVTVIVALAVGWWRDRSLIDAERAQLRARLEDYESGWLDLNDRGATYNYGFSEQIISKRILPNSSAPESNPRDK